VCIALFFTVARPGQLSTTHFRYFTPFFVIYSHTIVHCVHIYTPYYTGTCLHSPFRLRIVLHYSCCRLYTCRPCAWVYGTSHLYLRFSYTRFPSWRCLHAVYITRRFRTGLFTRCFSYLAFQTPLTCIIHRFHYTRIQSTRSTPPPRSMAPQQHNAQQDRYILLQFIMFNDIVIVY